MVSFGNNKWDVNEVADNLSKQLFTKKSKKKRNNGKKDLRVKKSKNTPEKSKLENKFNNNNNNKEFKRKSEKLSESPKKKFKKLKKSQISGEINKISKGKKETSSESPKKKFENLKKSKISEINEIEGKNKRKRRGKKRGIEENAERNLNFPNLKTKMKPENVKSENKKTEKVVKKLKLTKGEIDVEKLEQLLTLKGKLIKKSDKSQSLRERMVAQLRASRFRFLNETLYKSDSTVAKQLFKEDPDAFMAYHTGYQQQVNHWPLNPLDVIISAIKKMPKDYIIADLGCGEGKLADSVPQKVQSFDLVAVNDKITACDMAHTPLLISGVNVVVFCLSLMGTNLNDYLREANRVLKKDGILKIAEVESRFDSIDEFIKLLESFGFKNTWKDLSHNLFYFMDFKKISEIDRKPKKLPEISLKPCLYKKR